jgi:hypothetical protein
LFKNHAQDQEESVQTGLVKLALACGGSYFTVNHWQRLAKIRKFAMTRKLLWRFTFAFP